MIIERSKIEKERKRLRKEYKKECEIFYSKKEDYPGQRSDDGITGPREPQVCDCGYMSSNSDYYSDHYYHSHHKQFWKEIKEKINYNKINYNQYLFNESDDESDEELEKKKQREYKNKHITEIDTEIDKLERRIETLKVEKKLLNK